jgi:hypothetical protein
VIMMMILYQMLLRPDNGFCISGLPLAGLAAWQTFKRLYACIQLSE